VTYIAISSMFMVGCCAAPLLRIAGCWEAAAIFNFSRAGTGFCQLLVFFPDQTRRSVAVHPAGDKETAFSPLSPLLRTRIMSAEYNRNLQLVAANEQLRTEIEASNAREKLQTEAALQRKKEAAADSSLNHTLKVLTYLLPVRRRLATAKMFCPLS